MQSFPDMAEAHAWTLQRLREMAGRLTEQAYRRASAAMTPDRDGYDDPDEGARWMLVFDRMARGLRLSIALEARLSRERRRDAAEIGDRLAGQACDEPPAPPWRRAAPASDRVRDPCETERPESDRERDDDGLPQDAPLDRRLARLKAILDGGVETPTPLVRFVWQDPPPAAAAAPDERSADAPTHAWSPPAAPEAPCPPWRGSG
jgi:hypothetical protein